MLFGLIVLLAGASAPEGAVSAEDHELSELRLFVANTSGARFFDSSTEGLGFVTGVRVGLIAQRPPLFSGGNRLGVMPALSARHDFALQRTDWAGSLSAAVDLWMLRIFAGVGYGLSSLAGSAPAPLLDITLDLGVQLGPFWLGFGLDTSFRLAGDRRSLMLHATLAWAPLIRRE